MQVIGLFLVLVILSSAPNSYAMSDRIVRGIVEAEANGNLPRVMKKVVLPSSAKKIRTVAKKLDIKNGSSTEKFAWLLTMHEYVYFMEKSAGFGVEILLGGKAEWRHERKPPIVAASRAFDASYSDVADDHDDAREIILSSIAKHDDADDDDSKQMKMYEEATEKVLAAMRGKKRAVAKRICYLVSEYLLSQMIDKDVSRIVENMHGYYLEKLKKKSLKNPFESLQETEKLYERHLRKLSVDEMTYLAPFLSALIPEHLRSKNHRALLATIE